MQNKTQQTQICVLGSGIWGTAIATQINKKFGDCLIWTKSIQTLESINQHQFNKGVKLADTIFAEIAIEKLQNYKNIVIASPSYALHDVIGILKQLPSDIGLIIATKGLDVKNGQFISETFNQELDNKIALLSGASFADEVINNEFTALNLAANNINLATQLAKLLTTDTFHVIPSNDVTGLQLSGCMKNVIAILVGILKGLEFGDNLCSIIIAKGVYEIQAFARLLNQTSNPSCLAFASDTILSTTSIKSRNMSFGMKLATGLITDSTLIEGKLVAKSLQKFAAKYGFKSYLIDLVNQCIDNPVNLREKINQAVSEIFS